MMTNIEAICKQKKYIKREWNVVTEGFFTRASLKIVCNYRQKGRESENEG